LGKTETNNLQRKKAEREDQDLERGQWRRVAACHCRWQRVGRGREEG